MALDNNKIQEIISEKFGDKVSGFEVVKDILTFSVTPDAAKSLILFVHEDPTLRFNFMTDLCGVHYPDNDPSAQFAVVYLLHNWIDNVRIRIKSFLPAANPEIDTMSDVFAAANWMERETYDFFGIRFIGHPKLKRILNDDGMVDFPMRKEYALEDQFRTDKDDRFFGRKVNPNSLPDEKVASNEK